LGILALAAPASAVTVPFVEDFNVNASGWVAATSGPLTWNATGGPDGGAYVSSTFASQGAPQGTIQFRANDALNASGDAFVGNWIGSVSAISAQVIHNAPAPLTFFFRFAGAPGQAMVGQAPPIAPGVWTEILIPIDPAILIPAGGTFAGTLSNVINLQVGVIAPAELVGLDFTYGLDKVTLVAVPEPATAGCLAIGLALLAARARRRR
jgi:hypothetical protein